jgi:hypothetical protein
LSEQVVSEKFPRYLTDKRYLVEYRGVDAALAGSHPFDRSRDHLGESPFTRCGSRGPHLHQRWEGCACAGGQVLGCPGRERRNPWRRGQRRRQTFSAVPPPTGGEFGARARGSQSMGDHLQQECCAQVLGSQGRERKSRRGGKERGGPGQVSLPDRSLGHGWFGFVCQSTGGRRWVACCKHASRVF